MCLTVTVKYLRALNRPAWLFNKCNSKWLIDHGHRQWRISYTRSSTVVQSWMKSRVKLKPVIRAQHKQQHHKPQIVFFWNNSSRLSISLSEHQPAPWYQASTTNTHTTDKNFDRLILSVHLFYYLHLVFIISILLCPDFAAESYTGGLYVPMKEGQTTINVARWTQICITCDTSAAKNKNNSLTLDYLSVCVLILSAISC